MSEFGTKIRTYTVRDFISWQKASNLSLSPDFQRRAHWKPAAKSYLLDTMLRGYPIPPVFLRERARATDLEPKREVVDGQQRLRTLISYIAPRSLPDFDGLKDHFEISKKHYSRLAGAKFNDLTADDKSRLLEYEIAAHVLPPGTDDRIVLQIFARMNSTGTSLNYQELRNAEYFGDFKNISYELAYEQLEQWRNWSVFSSDNIARMMEVEMTSDLLILIMQGVTGKTRAIIDRVYENNDDGFTYQSEIVRRFRSVMKEIGQRFGAQIAHSAFSRPALFYTLFGAFYDRMYKLDSPLNVRKKIRRLPSDLPQKISAISDRISEGRVPKAYADAFEKATADVGRRERRLKYVTGGLGLG